MSDWRVQSLFSWIRLLSYSLFLFFLCLSLFSAADCYIAFNYQALSVTSPFTEVLYVLWANLHRSLYSTTYSIFCGSFSVCLLTSPFALFPIRNVFNDLEMAEMGLCANGTGSISVWIFVEQSKSDTTKRKVSQAQRTFHDSLRIVSFQAGS